MTFPKEHYVCNVYVKISEKSKFVKWLLPILLLSLIRRDFIFILFNRGNYSPPAAFHILPVVYASENANSP